MFRPIQIFSVPLARNGMGWRNWLLKTINYPVLQIKTCLFMNVLRKLSPPRNFHNSDANHIGQRTLQAKTYIPKVRNTIHQIWSERMRREQVGLCRSGKISTRQRSHQRQPLKYLATLNIYSITGPKFKGNSNEEMNRLDSKMMIMIIILPSFSQVVWTRESDASIQPDCG